jgi:hypothetical protein
MLYRKVTLELLDGVMQAPQQVLQQPNGRTIFQSIILEPSFSYHLLRVIVDLIENPSLVITVISTSQVTKYWRN